MGNAIGKPSWSDWVSIYVIWIVEKGLKKSILGLILRIMIDIDKRMVY
jgi:hypothetical protein